MSPLVRPNSGGNIKAGCRRLGVPDATARPWSTWIKSHSPPVGRYVQFPQHRVGTDMQRSRRIAYPARVETHVDDRLLHFGQAPAVAIVEQETALGTAGVLA